MNINCTAERYRGVFKNFPYFNYVQSKVFDDVSSADYGPELVFLLGHNTVLFFVGDIHRQPFGGISSNWQWKDSDIRACHHTTLDAD